MTIPTYVRRHLEALGVGDAGMDSIQREIDKAVHMTRDELAKSIENKSAAIRLLRLQQAVYLSLLEHGGAVPKDSAGVLPESQSVGGRVETLGKQDDL